jgi:peptidoglycan L-alanyl-D-glutamate endopeptidase CwlK
MTSRLDALDAAFIPLANAFIEALHEAQVPFIVTSTRRTDDEQIALFAQGRQNLAAVNILRMAARLRPITEKENQYTVTNLDGILKKSMHQLGLALDVVPMRWGQPTWPPGSDPAWMDIGLIGEASGLEWGGRWVGFPDRPHYQRRT